MRRLKQFSLTNALDEIGETFLSGKEYTVRGFGVERKGFQDKRTNPWAYSDVSGSSQKTLDERLRKERANLSELSRFNCLSPMSWRSNLIKGIVGTAIRVVSIFSKLRKGRLERHTQGSASFRENLWRCQSFCCRNCPLENCLRRLYAMQCLSTCLL